MFKVNCWNGDKRRVVKARITLDLQFLVGGTDDEDREDSIREALNDHYKDMVDRSFWRDAITGMSIESVKTDSPGPDDMLELRRKAPPVLACRVRVRVLAPAIHVVENMEAVEHVMRHGYAPKEEWSVDERKGLVHIPGVGDAGDGDYIVADRQSRTVELYRSREALLERYEGVKEVGNG